MAAAASAVEAAAVQAAAWDTDIRSLLLTTLDPEVFQQAMANWNDSTVGGAWRENTAAAQMAAMEDPTDPGLMREATRAQVYEVLGLCIAAQRARDEERRNE